MDVPPGERVAVSLDRVSETLLWTLYHRAVEARRPDGVIEDPMAISLVERIDYPFAERFGPGQAAQAQALRARCFDQVVRHFLVERPGGTVVALGEGLETQFWRVDDGRVRWLSVDLPQTVEVRRSLLPEPPRMRSYAGSVLEPGWRAAAERLAAEAAAAGGHDEVVVTAEGLFMYLQPPQVRDLIAACADAFPGGCLVFDAMPRWFTALTRRGLLRSPDYQAPPMPWGMDADEREKLWAVHPNIVEVRDIPPPPGRGVLGPVGMRLLDRLPVVRVRRPSVTLLRFGPRARGR